jgi:hypothetical protein
MWEDTDGGSYLGLDSLTMYTRKDEEEDESYANLP